MQPLAAAILLLAALAPTPALARPPATIFIGDTGRFLIEIERR